MPDLPKTPKKKPWWKRLATWVAEVVAEWLKSKATK